VYLRIANRKHGGKFPNGEVVRFYGHDPSMACSDNHRLINFDQIDEYILRAAFPWLVLAINLVVCINGHTRSDGFDVCPSHHRSVFDFYRVTASMVMLPPDPGSRPMLTKRKILGHPK
jgi:hypothetical protein